MAVPSLLRTSALNEQYAGVTYHIEGELVPVLQVELSSMGIYFEHHVLLWKDPAVNVGVKTLKGAFKRIFAGMPIFMTEAKGNGRIAFSRDGVGHVFGIHLKKGQSLDVREHQFLAATDNVDYSFRRVQGAANMLFSGSGLFIDTFTTPHDEGIVWLHGYGNIFETTLQSGEQIDIEPGGWVYKDPTVNMETKLQRISTGFFASAGNLVWNRFTGPGRIGIQSMYIHLAGEAT
ncbi:MAG TPA: AIM24 family protein [Phycisphaerae bacterium]|nr:AIM24 family protein [Phycisphaerae bacterium]